MADLGAARRELMVDLDPALDTMLPVARTGLSVYRDYQARVRPGSFPVTAEVVAGLASDYDLSAASVRSLAVRPAETGLLAQLTLAAPRRTPHVFCRPLEAGGSGDSSIHTAAGVLAAMRAVCAAMFRSPQPAGRRFAILGLGRVGAHLARNLAAEGAELIVSDIDITKRGLADDLGATWLDPQDALRAEVDVLVPAALGGLLTRDTVPLLRCAAITGPANNQLDAPATANLLHQRGILWATDFVVSAGGVIHATAVELRHETAEQATRRVARIGDTVAHVLETAQQAATTPAAAALELARQRIQKATAPAACRSAPPTC
jgi:glutamate dehydrogenase/leucine dehydrogenase